MYNDFYGFSQSPFNITPDPRLLFFSHKHREAFNHLLYGIIERKGFIQITGEVGAGKTTLCRALLEHLEGIENPTPSGEAGRGANGKPHHRFKTALILNPCMTELQLLQAILAELGLKASKQNRVGYLETLNRFLLEQVEEGNDVVLIIDEAQDLSFELLEQVRLLSNLETDQRKLLQIVLIGQPELRRKLNDPRLRQLRQRITVRYHLTPLSRPEMEQYIRHRIHVCGGNGRPDFNRWALRKIYRYSQGVPRLINAVCDKALLCGYVMGTDCFKASHIRRAIRELEGRFT